MRDKSVIFALIPLFSVIVIAIFFRVILQDNIYFSNNLITYTKPVCSLDRHTFTGETCPECSRHIKDTGVFFKKDDATNKIIKDRSLPFKDYYNSYKDFKKDYDNMLCVSYVMITILVVAWIDIVLITLLPLMKRFR